MTDLTDKYARLLEMVSKDYDHQELSEIIDETKNIIKNNYSSYTNSNQAGGLYVITKLYQIGKLDKSEIQNILKNFFNFIDNNYQQELNDLVMNLDQLDFDLKFYIKFIEICN